MSDEPRSAVEEGGIRRREKGKKAREQRRGREPGKTGEEGCCEATGTAAGSTLDTKARWVKAFGQLHSTELDDFLGKDFERAQTVLTGTPSKAESKANVTKEAGQFLGPERAAEHLQQETNRAEVTRSDQLRISDDALNYFLPPISTPLAPHVTGTLQDHLFPWLGEMEPTRLCQSTGIRLLGPTCPRNPSDYTPPPKTEPFL